jgi:hypothetical protein
MYMIDTRRFRRSAVLAFGIIAATAAQAETFDAAFVAAHSEARVARIVVTGNERTHSSVILELTGISEGEKLTEVDCEKAKQKLLLSGIFSEVSLSAVIDESGSAVVTIEVKDKWTLIPVPSGSYGSGGWSAGLDIVEFNLFGLRKTLVVGGSDSNLGLSGTIAYIDPRFLGADVTLQVYASYARSSEEATYMDDSDFADFIAATESGGFALAYPSDKTLYAQPRFTVRYRGLSDGDAEKYDQKTDYFVLVPGVDLIYDDERFTTYHKSGPSASLTYTHGFDLSGGSPYDAVSGQVDFKLDTFWDGLAECGFVGSYGSECFMLQSALSGVGYRTIPQGSSYAADSAALYASLDLPFVKAKWAVMTLGAFYEGGAYATGLEGQSVAFFHGPGLSYRLYLHNIALPAAGIDMAYNIPAGLPVFSVNVGVSL